MFEDLTAPSPIWLAAVPVLVAAWIWALREVDRFVLFGVMSALVVPAAVVTPGQTHIALADVLLLVALGAWLVAGSVGAAPPPWIKGNPLLIPGLLFAWVTAESLAWSINPHATIETAIQIFEIVVVFTLVFASLPRSLTTIRRGMEVFIGVTCVMAVVTVVSFIPRAAAGDLTGQVLPGGMNKNVVGSYLAAGLVVAFAFWLRATERSARRLLLAAVLITGVGLGATLSRGSFLGAFCALIVVSLLLRRHQVLTAVLAVALAASYLVVVGPDSNVDLSVAGSYDSSQVRVFSFEDAVNKIEARPLLGSGAGTYEAFVPELNLRLADPNNMLLLTLAELGVIGLVALLFLLYRFGAAFVAARRFPEYAAVPAVAAGGVALSLLVHFQVDVTWTRGTASLAFAMIGLMVAVSRLCSVRVPEHSGLYRDRSPVAAATTVA